MAQSFYCAFSSNLYLDIYLDNLSTIIQNATGRSELYSYYNEIVYIDVNTKKNIEVGNYYFLHSRTKDEFNFNNYL